MPLNLLAAGRGPTSPDTTQKWRVTIDSSGGVTGLLFLAAGPSGTGNITSSRGNVMTYLGHVNLAGTGLWGAIYLGVLTNPGAGDQYADPAGGVSPAEAHIAIFDDAATWAMVGSPNVGDDNTFAWTATNINAGQNPLGAFAGAQAGDAIITGVLYTGGSVPPSISALPSGSEILTSPGAVEFFGGLYLYNVPSTASVQPVIAWGDTRRTGAIAVLLRAAPGPDLTGDITTDDAAPTGLLSTGASVLTGDVTTDDAAPTGALGVQSSTVASLPFTRNPGNGGRLVDLPNVAVAVLTDDANLTRLNGSTGLLMDSAGVVTFANGAPVPPGSSVILLTREPGLSGALGVDRRITS